MISNSKIKVLIVDDSAFVRKTLQNIINESGVAEVIAVASDPYFAVKKIQKQKPDVISLDIQMPRMDGLTFLKKIMTQHPIPVIVVSTLTQNQSETALEAYRLGAIQVMEKPDIFNADILNEWKSYFIDSIIAASQSNISPNRNKIAIPIVKTKNKQHKITTNSEKIVLIGSSAGGTEVVNQILSKLDENTVPIAIAQHMPAQFTKSYAERLNKTSVLKVKEAEMDEVMMTGHAYISPGNKHLIIHKTQAKYVLKTTNNNKRNRYRPSVDVLFESALNIKGENIMAIILSGMGNDGTKAMKVLKSNGAITIAQNKSSSVVYGMPKSAYESEAATYSLSIEEIINAIKKFSNS